MTDLLLPDEIEIPDSIEPLIKWKALTVSKDGTLLYSPNQNMPWPVKERAEATCKTSWDYGWEPVSHLPNIPTEEGYSYGPTFHTTSGSVVMYGSYYGQREPVPSQQMPLVELPDGLNWSWEGKPHQVVSESCGCGIYCVDTPEACLSYCRDKAVICKIAVWGRVVPGTYGARAEYAYPQSIEYAMGLSNKGLMELAERYGLSLPEGEVIYVPKDAEELTKGSSVFQVYTGPTTFPGATTNAVPVAWTPITSANSFTLLSLPEELPKDHDFVREVITIFGLTVSFCFLLVIALLGQTAAVRLCATFAILAGALAITAWAGKKNA